MASQPQTFKHALPDGSIAKRTSKTRVYTHVIVGRIDRDSAIAHVLSPKWEENDRSSYRFRKARSETAVGETMPDFPYPLSERDKQEAVEFIRKYPTEDSYVAHERERQLAHYAPELCQPEVIQWSQSLANAQKGLSAASRHGYFIDVHVEAINHGTR